MIKTHHIDEAYQWLCKQRRHYPANSDIWHLRFHWEAERQRIIHALSKGDYYFAPLQLLKKSDGTTIHLWSSVDSLVLKALTLAITPLLPISTRCTHVKGHGGLKFTVREVSANLANKHFVMRTDVMAFYETIDHTLLLEKLAPYIKDRFILRLLWQSMARCVERGGLFRDIKRGIARGCPLSPLLGAFYLTELDHAFAHQGLFYVRYMDDILIMTRTRWTLRKAIKRLNSLFNALQLEKHPHKTFIGRTEKGFDFLGYHFGQKTLRLAATTLVRFREHILRLYEQKPSAQSLQEERADWLEDTITRWVRWAFAGLAVPLMISFSKV